MEEKQLKSLESILAEPKNIVIVPHVNPDGDAMGSTLALQHFLKAMEHNAAVITPNNYPDFLEWLPGSTGVIIFEDETERAKKIIAQADVIFTLDFNDLTRSGYQMTDVLKESSATFVMIDHHQEPERYADFMYSDANSSSTCELIYDFINRLNRIHLITVDIATCLYTGIMTDTGSFRFSSTSSNTHRVIADLIDKGANNAMIHENIFDTKTPQQLRLLGVALKNLKVIEEFQTAYITLSQEELNQSGFRKGGTEGFVNYGLSLKGIVFAVIFIENKQEGIIKISFRSKGRFDVNKFARAHFDGGGHLNAAGGKSGKNMEDTILHFESLLKKYHNLKKK